MEDKKKNRLEIRMLGGLSITYEDKPLVLTKNVTSKMIHLFLMLLYYRDSGVAREELIQVLYEDTDPMQASNSFRAMVFRLRKSLALSGLPAGEYITTKGGVYRWESDGIEVDLDVEKFAGLAARGLHEENTSRKRRLLEQAIRLYRGEFLPSMIIEDWVAVSNREFQDVYFKCMRALMEILKMRKDYGELLLCCEKITELYPYEEWQLEKLDCLIGMKDYNRALRYYDEAVNQYQEEFGLLPSEEWRKRRHEIREQIDYEIQSIHEIQEVFLEEEEPGGATFCDLSVFTVAYRYMMKAIDRIGLSVYLILCTLTDKKQMPIDRPEVLDATREALLKAVGDSVRQSDLYTRYGKNQVLILLVGSNEHGCGLATNRIRGKFQQYNTHKKVEICFTINSIAEVEPDQINRKFNQGSLDWR